MKFTIWTFAQNGKRPALFPEAAHGPVLLAGGDGQNPHSLKADARNFAACMNEAARRATEGFVIFAPPDLLDFAAGWRERLTDAAREHEQGRFFYGDYLLREAAGDQRQTVRADIGDISEREDWGPLWAVRVPWLLKTGGLDEQNPRAAFYDLLLKSWGSGQRVHVGGPLAVISAPAPDDTAESAKRKLFFPGRGKLGGFSYLFMDPEDERQTEAVFYSFLKREQAFLEGTLSLIPPSPAKLSPMVAVITAVFNREKFIGRAIESVQAQTLGDWEYVIVDNGSSDRTREVVKEYAAKDARIRLVENDRNIIALSLNLAVKAARGKYIAQLDSDDNYLPHTLEKMTAALEANPTWGLAIGYYELMNETGNPLPEFGIIKHLEYNRNNILRVDGAGAPRVWHRSVMLQFGLFDEKELGHYGEDYDLVLKVGEKYEVGRVHEVCYRYRRHADNTDVRRDPEMKIYNKTLARLHALKRRQVMNLPSPKP
jgi:GT2 family glycosyltransferase